MKLIIKSMNNKHACSGFFPHPDDLSQEAKAEGRNKVLPGEVFEADEKSAKAYLKTGKVEKV